MSFQNINTRGPINQTQAKNLATAREVKKNVLKTAGRFQKLDNQPGDVATEKDLVLVRGNEQKELPQSTGNKLARLAVGILAPEESKAEASGWTKAENGNVVRADIETQGEDGKKAAYQYRKLKDGTEIYHGPTADGYAVIKENKKDGTLMMLTSDQPATDDYWKATSWAAPTQPQSDHATAPQPKTFEETLKDFAGGQQATGLGTLAGQVKDKAEQALEKGKNAVQDAMATPAEREALPESRPREGKFKSSFGQPTGESPKASAEEGPTDFSETMKQAGEKVDETARQTVKSVKDWTETDTADKIGTILFGKLNPFGKKG